MGLKVLQFFVIVVQLDISLMSCQDKHLKRNSISTHAHVLFSIYHIDTDEIP